MKLVVTRNIRNVPALRLKDEDGKSTVAGVVHNDQIHKGAILEIGKAATLEEMRKTERQNAEVCALLFLAKSVEEATPESIARINEEIREEKGREAKQAALGGSPPK